MLSPGRAKLQGEKARDWLLTFCCQFFRDRVLAILGEKDHDGSLVRKVGEAVCLATLDRLGADLPGLAKRDDETRLRQYPDRALAILNQNLCYLADSWLDDFVAEPAESYADRATKLLPTLRHPPARTGRSGLGIWISLHRLNEYDSARATLSGDLGFRASAGLPMQDRVEALYGRRLSPEEYAQLGGSDPDEVALRYAARPMGDLPTLTPAYLRRLLPGLRERAQRLNAALAGAAD